MMAEVLCIGELLIDFICEDIGMGLVEGNRFIKKAGGAPANVAAAIARLGGSSAFMGKVGNDHFGNYLQQYLNSFGIDTSGLVIDMSHPTTLAFVSLQHDGERDFIFNRGADQHLSRFEVDEVLYQRIPIIHFGAATAFLEEPLRDTYKNLLEKARGQGKFISFDPNFRIDLWKGREREYINAIMDQLHDVDFVKLSEEEAKLLYQTGDLNECCVKMHEKGIKIAAITLGKKGTLLSMKDRAQIIESIPIQSIDSTGAGDAFVGGFLYKVSLLLNSKDVLQHPEKVMEYVRFANRVGALTCTRMGAMDALPTMKEVEEEIK